MASRTVAFILGFLLVLLSQGCKIDPIPADPSVLVIETFDPASFSENDTYLTLTDASGNVIAEDDNGNPDQINHKGCSRITIQGGLPSGTYYISVRNPSGRPNPNYGIRVLDFDPGVDYPTLAPANEDESLVFLDNDVSGNKTTPVRIETGQILNRSTFPNSDVDWFELVIP